jgi:hypothetical protein
MAVKIEQVFFTDVYEELLPLFKAHWVELYIKGGPENLLVNYGFYRDMEAIGQYVGLVAKDGDKLIGYLSCLISNPPHHADITSGLVDCMYLDANSRKGSLGMRMIKKCEEVLKKQDVDFMQIATNVKKDLSKLMCRMDYVPMDIIYSKKL